MRHRRLRGPDGLGQVAHAQLSGLEQRVEQPGTGRVAEELEQVGKPGGLVPVDETLPHGGDPGGVHELGRTHVKPDQGVLLR